MKILIWKTLKHFYRIRWKLNEFGLNMFVVVVKPKLKLPKLNLSVIHHSYLLDENVEIVYRIFPFSAPIMFR